MTPILIDDFLPDLYVITNTAEVKSLALKLFGKRDKSYVYLHVFRMDDCPELDNRECHVSYTAFNNALKIRFSSILYRSSTITMHTIRKIAYLFAVWGRGDYATIKTCARHKNDCTAALYLQDAKL